MLERQPLHGCRKIVKIGGDMALFRITDGQTGSAAAARIAGIGVLLVALGLLAAGCGSTGVGSRSAQTSSVAEGSDTAGGTLRAEPSGSEAPRPQSDRGLAISLGGPPSGRGGISGGYYSFSEKNRTKCVPIGSDALTELPAMPLGMSIGVTTTVRGQPAGAFAAADGAGCVTPCNGYVFTTTTWHCQQGVTLQGKNGDGGYIAVAFTVYCGTADETKCRQWAATNYNPDGVDLGAHGDQSGNIVDPTTSREPTTNTSTTTTTTPQPTADTPVPTSGVR